MTERANRETWQDWQARDARDTPLISRAELLAEFVDRAGRPLVSGSQLRAWERAGVLPPPTIQKHGDLVQAVYPRWIFHLLRELLALRRAGMLLAEIGPRLRVEARRITRRRRRQERLTEWEPLRAGAVYPLRPTHLVPEIARHAAGTIRNLATPYRIQGIAIPRAEIVLYDERGTAIRYNFTADATGIFQVGDTERTSLDITFDVPATEEQQLARMLTPREQRDPDEEIDPEEFPLIDPSRPELGHLALDVDNPGESDCV